MVQRLKLQSFYDQLSATIRKADPQTPLCFQPVTFDNFVPSGFSHAPGGNKFKNQSILCYHHYQPPALGLIQLDTYVKDAKRMGVASLLSETYGQVQTLERAQKLKQSWMYWLYKDFGGMNKSTPRGKSTPTSGSNQDGVLPLDNLLTQDNLKMTQNLVRTYLPRVAGQLQYSKYNSTTKHFSAVYFASPGQQTILYLSKDRIYSNSYLINVYPDSQVKVIENDGNFVTIKYQGKYVNRKIMISVSKI